MWRRFALLAYNIVLHLLLQILSTVASSSRMLCLRTAHLFNPSDQKRISPQVTETQRQDAKKSRQPRANESRKRRTQATAHQRQTTQHPRRAAPANSILISHPSATQPHISSPRSTLMARPPRLSNNLGHLVDLPLRTPKRAQPLLRQFPRALVLRVPQQFDDPAFVRRQPVFVSGGFGSPGGGNGPSDFLDDFADEARAFAQAAFGGGDAGGGLEGSDFLWVG